MLNLLRFSRLAPTLAAASPLLIYQYKAQQLQAPRHFQLWQQQEPTNKASRLWKLSLRGGSIVHHI
jgi:hypothetical protein